jgi:RNA polymerase sigma factor (TIGR02999 family)
MNVMPDVTVILAQAQQGDPNAANVLLTLVYDELRRLAAYRLAQENPGQTLQATALVHEAYIRLVGPGANARFDHRGHFFAAAAEAMRRILVEKARQKKSQKHGGDFNRGELADAPSTDQDPLEILAVHEALEQLALKSPRKAELVKLRYFLGCTIPEAADALGIAPATAEEDWTFAKAFLRRHWLKGEGNSLEK